MFFGLAILPIASIHLKAVLVVKDAIAIFHVMLPPATILGAVCVEHGALAMSFAIRELAAVLTVVFIIKTTNAIGSVIFPLAKILKVTGWVERFALATTHVILPLAIILNVLNVVVYLVKDALATGLVIIELAFVSVAIYTVVDTLALFLVILELAFILLVALGIV
jgi:hypothetical protein